MARLALGLLAAWYMCPGLSGKPMGFQEAAGGIWFPSYQAHTVPVEESVSALSRFRLFKPEPC